MLNHNLTMMNEDGTADPAGTFLLPATGKPMPSKTMMGTTGPQSFGRRMARVGTGLLLLLLVAEGGAVVVPEKEDDEGALLWSNSVSSSPGRLRRVVGAGRAAPGAAAAEEGSARTPRRHRRTLVAKKNPQQAPPTEYDGAVVDVGEPLCEYSDQCSCSDVVCPTRCQKNYAYCFADVNTCLNDPTSTCSDMYYKIITTCGCDTEFTCASGILRQDGIKTILVDNLSNCLFIYWDTPPPSCWESGTICVAFTTCHNCCNSWEWTPLPLTWGSCL